jgi:hypothetical protein
MNQGDLIALQFRMKHTRNGTQKRGLIDSYPELKGWAISRVKNLLNTATELSTGKKRTRHVRVGGRWITVERKIQFKGLELAIL